MRWMLLALCACNRILGLGDLDVRDPRFDALVDAQPYCPPFGTLPRFSPVLREYVDENCIGYETSEMGAVASCTYATLGTVVSQGPIGQLLAPITGLPALPVAHFYMDPRISPEGDVLYVNDVDIDVEPFTATYLSFTRRADGSWAPGPTLPLSEYNVVSPPSRGPQRHLLYAVSPAIQEWAQDTGGTWHQVGTLDISDAVVAIWLAPDGLRAAIIVSSPPNDRMVLYTDRASISDAFTAPVPLPSLPGGYDLFVSADCSRAYMSGALSVFYATQI